MSGKNWRRNSNAAEKIVMYAAQKGPSVTVTQITRRAKDGAEACHPDRFCPIILLEEIQNINGPRA